MTPQTAAATVERLPPPAAQPRRRRFNRQEFNQMAEAGMFARNPHVELLFGEVVEMTPQNYLHANAIMRLNAVLCEVVGRRFAVRPQLPLGIADEHEPEPDLCIVDWPETPDAGHPATARMVVEVADSSLEFDRNVKSKVYALAGVPEYWVVDVNARLVEVYTQPHGDVYRAKRTLQHGEAIELVAVPEAIVDVARVFGR